MPKTDDFFCSICGQVALAGFPHRCPPVWTVHADGDPDYTLQIRARQAQDAAEQFADRYDDGGNLSYQGTELNLIVTGNGQPAHTFTVECGYEPVYRAHQTLRATEAPQ